MMPKSNEILSKVTSCLLHIKIITVSRESIKYTCLNAHNQMSVKFKWIGENEMTVYQHVTKTTNKKADLIHNTCKQRKTLKKNNCVGAHILTS